MTIHPEPEPVSVSDRPQQTPEDYRPPEMWVLGRFAELTQGGDSGEEFDINSGHVSTV